MKSSIQSIARKTGDYAVKGWISASGLIKRSAYSLRENRRVVIGFNFLVVAATFLAAFIFIAAGVPVIREHLVPRARLSVSDSTLVKEPAYRKTINSVQRELQLAERKFDALTPGQSYLVINTTDNRFYLYRHRKLVREGFCSSGSYIQLLSHDSREWIFRTPKGVFRIQGKTTYPIWKKPDWAFIEEGLPVPPPDHHTRFERGVLGDYALSLGDGYLIHGTIYKRFLGMPVTHGCVRLNDDDLEYIFNSLNVGSKVFIY